MEEDVRNMREMLKRAVSFDNVSVFADLPTDTLNAHDQSSTSGDASPDEPSTPQQEPYSSSSPQMQRHSNHHIATKKLCIVMVGLPARGKTHIARCLERYLNWLGFNAAVFNVGIYRRMMLGGNQSADFFNPENEEGLRARMELAMECLKDMLRWFGRGGLVGIYDATNSTKKRRKIVKDRLESVGVRVLFLESLCSDQSIIEKNILETKLHSPDYRHVDPEEATSDFKRRIQQYESVSETVEDSEHCSYIKIINVGRQLILNEIQGYAQAKIVSFLLNAHIMPRTIYLSRHGESEWNVTGQLGGDPPLTKRGQAYAQALARFMESEFTEVGKALPHIWTSQLQRTRQTVELIPAINMRWRALNEIDAGICEGLTYNLIDQRYPDVARDRKLDKLKYRYPGGESYVDVIHRLEPVILEIERERGPLLIVAHNAVIRSIYAYLMGKPQDECPHINVPLHTVFKLTTRAYGAEEERLPLEVDSTYQNKTPDSGDSDCVEESVKRVDETTSSFEALHINGEVGSHDLDDMPSKLDISDTSRAVIR